MERRTMLATSLALAASAAKAQTGDPAAKPAATPVSATGSNFILGADVPWVPMAEWDIVQRGTDEQTGERVMIAAGEDELKRAPENAVRYRSKTFTFPTGEIRVLEFTKAGGGVLHQITLETELYVVSGSAQVGVAGKIVELEAGDGVNLPSGILRSLKSGAEDTTVLLFTVGNHVAAPKASVIHGRDVEMTGLSGDDKAKEGDASLQTGIRRYTFDGNSFRVVDHIGKGKTSPVSPGRDVLIYMLSGSKTLTVGDETKVVQAGDAVREQMGLPTYWDVPGGTSRFIATDAPFKPNPAA